MGERIELEKLNIVLFFKVWLSYFQLMKRWGYRIHVPNNCRPLISCIGLRCLILPIVLQQRLSEWALSQMLEIQCVSWDHLYLFMLDGVFSIVEGMIYFFLLNTFSVCHGSPQEGGSRKAERVLLITQRPVGWKKSVWYSARRSLYHGEFDR